MAQKGIRPDQMVEVDGILYRPEDKPTKAEAATTQAARKITPTRNTGGSGSSEGTAPEADVATDESNLVTTGDAEPPAGTGTAAPSADADSATAKRRARR